MSVLQQIMQMVTFVTTLFLLAACDLGVPVENQSEAGRQLESIATPDDLLRAVATRNVDSVIQAFNEIDRMTYRARFLPTLEALWLRDRSIGQDLPWEVINLPEVRLAIANTLAQAHFNGQRTDHIDSIHEYARQQLLSPNRDVAFASMTVIGWFNDADDVLELERLGQRDDLTRATTVTLNSMCVPEADSAVQRILANCSGHICSELEDARTEMLAFKSRTGWCAGYTEVR